MTFANTAMSGSVGAVKASKYILYRFGRGDGEMDPWVNQGTTGCHLQISPQAKRLFRKPAFFPSDL